MQLATPFSRLRRGVRRLALTICALILGAGFTPALPSTVEPAPPAAVSFAAAPAPAPQSTVEEPAFFAAPAPPPAAPAAAPPLTSRVVAAVSGRAPPAHPA